MIVQLALHPPLPVSTQEKDFTYMTVLESRTPALHQERVLQTLNTP